MKNGNEIIKSETVRLLGIDESNMAKEVEDLINSGMNPIVEPYAKEVDVILSITAKDKNEQEASNLI